MAVKFFRGDVSPDGRVDEEVAIACAVEHPCLTRVRAAVPGSDAIVMDLAAGRPLAGRPTSKHLLRCKWVGLWGAGGRGWEEVCAGVQVGGEVAPWLCGRDMAVVPRKEVADLGGMEGGPGVERRGCERVRVGMRGSGSGSVASVGHTHGVSSLPACRVGATGDTHDYMRQKRGGGGHPCERVLYFSEVLQGICTVVEAALTSQIC